MEKRTIKVKETMCMNDTNKTKLKELLVGTTKREKILNLIFFASIIFMVGIILGMRIAKSMVDSIVKNRTEGALSDWFSVDENTQVRFAKGNLQYNAALDEWRFAEHQYDFIGKDNENISPIYDGWIDLFGWGTSGWNCGSPYYHPYDTVQDADYGPAEVGLGGKYTNSDWGYFNSIANGGDKPSLWRTLNGVEWQYLFFYRHGLAYTLGIVHDVKGMLLFPDEWKNPKGMDIVKSNSCADNVFSDEQWNLLEEKGVVFLPLAGIRRGGYYNNVNDSLCFASYWTSSMGMDMGVINEGDTDTLSYKAATSVFITDDQNVPFVTPFTPRNTGSSVRLVSIYVKKQKD